MKGPLDIDSLLSGVITLPSMPATLARITEMIDKEEVSLAQVGRVIASDPGIAMKTLRLVNSASYGLGQQIVNIDHAVVMLGSRVIKNLVITATVFETMKKGTESFLLHCVACGVAMQVLVEKGPLAGQLESPDEAFVLGLFHDVGKVIFAEYLPREQAEVERLARLEKIPWFEAERQIIGVDHAELGGRLAAQWKLPPLFVHSIAGHHCPADVEPEYQSHAAALAAADHLCNAAGMTCSENSIPPSSHGAWEMLGVDGRAALQVCGDFFDWLPRVKECLTFAE